MKKFGYCLQFIVLNQFSAWTYGFNDHKLTNQPEVSNYITADGEMNGFAEMPQSDTANWKNNNHQFKQHQVVDKCMQQAD